jgi:hypothetical protein
LLPIIGGLLWWEHKSYRRRRNEHLRKTGYGFMLDSDDE